MKLLQHKLALWEQAICPTSQRPDSKLISFHNHYAQAYPIQVQVDNKAGISFQQSYCTNMDSRLKGIYDLRLEWVRELKYKSVVTAIKVDTLDNIADILTKGSFTAEQWKRLCALANIWMRSEPAKGRAR